MFKSRPGLLIGIMMLSATAIAVDENWNMSLAEPSGMAVPLVHSVTDIIAGSHATLSVSGLQPYDLVVVLMSGTTGQDAIGDCAVTGLMNPAIRGAAIANSGGSANIEVFVPSVSAGAILHLQALTPGGCDVSEVLTTGAN